MDKRFRSLLLGAWLRYRSLILGDWLSPEAIHWIDGAVRQIARSLGAPVPCDACGERIPRHAPKMRHIHAFNGRLNVVRTWGFCSEACREAWWSAADDGDFLPLREGEETMLDATALFAHDAPTHVSVIDDDGPRSGYLGVVVQNPVDDAPILIVPQGRLRLSTICVHPASVNAWWRKPGETLLSDEVVWGAEDEGRVAA